MAYGGLNWQVMNLPLAAGLQQRTDDRARPQPYLDICHDAQFDEIGGTQTRLPYLAMSNNIFGGGTLSNCRRLAVVNGELVLFTNDSLYSWNVQQSAWVLRGTHLAVAVAETPVFATTGDQIDGDRAELSGTVVYAWSEGGIMFAAAVDKASGSVLTSPVSQIGSSSRPRLVTLATKILLFFEVGTALKVLAIDPASPATALTGGPLVTVLAAGTFNLYYDVVRAGTQDLVVGACRRVTTTSYTAFTVTPALTVTTSTKARTADGPLAVSAIPDGTQTQVVRANGTNIQGDLLTTSTLADVFTAQAVGTAAGTPVNQIAAAHRSVQNGGAYRCYAFWSAQESASSASWVSKFNFVDNANTLGTQANFIRHLAPASRAFDYAGSIYVWLTFAGATTFNGTGSFSVPNIALQNTYFLYRDDTFLVAKSIAGQGGGFAASTGRLPGVALTSASTGFSWCGTKRRRIEVANEGRNFAAREPVDVVFTFDTNEARRAAVLGQTLYIAAGELLQYDGTRLTEVGFHIYPWVLSMIDSALGGAVAVGPYAYKSTWRCPNARGETERSTTATIGLVTVTGNSVTVPTIAPLTVTHKTTVPPAVEFWRTIINPTPEFPFYLVTSNDPAALTNPNRYEPNDPTLSSLPQLTDLLSDASIAVLETNPENGGALENLSPPPAAIIVATDTRLFLAGVAGDPDRVWYSRERNDGEVASFHDVLTIDIPRQGGAITAIWFQDETLYVARQSALYVVPGRGLDNAGGGAGFGPARVISADIGVISQESVVLTPHGTLFQSKKGWQLLDRSGSAVLYVGGAIFDYETETVLATSIAETQHHVRILTNQRVILWAYPREGGAGGSYPQQMAAGGQWGDWTVSDGVHACMWQGQHVILTATGPKVQQATYSNLTYGLDVEETWIKVADLQGAARCRRVQPLGEARSEFLLRMRLAYNYDPTYVDDVVWSLASGTLQVSHGPQRPACEAIKVRLTAVAELARAHLLTAAALSPVVGTSGTAWTATWNATSAFPGELGNALSMSISFESGANLVDVRDHFGWQPSLSAWLPVIGRIGVRVRCTAGTLTVAALETAIAAGTALATLAAADATPTKTIDIATMAGQSATGAFSAGTFTAPTGEAMKLTGLALDVGIEGGLYRRLAAAQKA